MSLPTALVSHPACNRHDAGPGHPESRARLPALLEAVRRDADLAPRLVEREATAAEEQDLLRVHTPEHLVWIRQAAAEARRRGEILQLDPDTAVSADSWDAALAAAGCAIAAAGLAARGEAGGAFALCRPPGHHATVHRAMGFCLFNNLAVAARAMQAHGLAERILVVDWDVHHGNGTQDVFYADPTVSFLSLHLAPHYPGTGGADERGAGVGHTTRRLPAQHATERQPDLEGAVTCLGLRQPRATCNHLSTKRGVALARKASPSVLAPHAPRAGAPPP